MQNKIILAILFATVFSFSLVFADHGQFGIRTGDITSQSCAAENTCFIPSDMSIDVGSEITWINDSHVSLWLIIEPQNIPNAKTIESGQIRGGTTFTITSDVPGDYYYYSREQPWAHGIVTFEGESHIEEIPEPTESETVITTEIPDWVKNNAGWWAEGQIGDSDFVAGIQYLIENNVIVIPETQSGESSTKDIPDWVKNNAGWWAEGQIGDSDFVAGIQYLIENGIISI